MSDTVESQVLDFVRGLKPENRDVAADTDLIATGSLDSLAVLELVSFIGERFSVVPPISDITPDNLRTVETIVGLVEGKWK